MDKEYLQILEELNKNPATVSDIADKLLKSNQRISSLLRNLGMDAYVSHNSVQGREVFCITDMGKKHILQLKEQIRKDEVLRKVKGLEPIDQIVKKYNDANEFKDENAISDKIAGDSNSLKEYLKKISNLETNIYELSERYKFLSNKYIDIFIKDTPPIEGPLKEFRSTLVQPVCPYKDFSKPASPILDKPGLFNRKRVEEDNRIKLEKYEAELKEYQILSEAFEDRQKKYNSDVAAYNEAYEKEKDAFYAKEKEKFYAQKNAHDVRIREEKAMVRKEADILKEQLEQTIKVRNELYSKGVIYNKYRNDVAVATFYDYLMSGRCTTLEGPDGAYNLFESELRQDIIICQLDAALVALDKIQKNQYYLYEQLEEANRSLDLINGQLLLNNAIALEQLDVLNSINTNTQVAAFYSKKNAELTDAIGFMVAMR